MQFIKIVKLLTITLFAAALMAQDGGIRGPVSGLVYDGSARAVRPVVGVPGAAYLGRPLLSDLDFAAPSPDSKSVIALSAGRLYLIRDLEGTPRWTILEDNSEADRAAWSADSTSAAVHSAGNVRLFSGLKSVKSASVSRLSPRSKARTVRRGVDGLPESADIGAAPGEISALAIDERGDVLAGVDGGIYLGRSGDSFRLVATVARPGGIAVDGDRIFVTDRSRNEVLEISNYREAADTVLFAGADRGVADPAALAISTDGKSLIVASASERRLVWLDLASRAASGRIDLDFEPSRLEARNGGSLFLLNSRGAGEETLQVLAGGRNPAVYFIPAGRGTAASQESPVEE